MDNEKLLVARAEIEAVLKQHDIAGHVVLYMPGYCENFSHYEPSFSRARVLLNEHGVMVGMHIHSKLAEHYNGDKAAQKRDLEATAGTLSSMGKLLAHDAISLLELAGQVDKATGAEHEGFRDINPKRPTRSN